MTFSSSPTDNTIIHNTKKAPQSLKDGLQKSKLKDFGTSFRIDIFRKPFEADAEDVIHLYS